MVHVEKIDEGQEYVQVLLHVRRHHDEKISFLVLMTVGVVVVLIILLLLILNQIEVFQDHLVFR